jgi:hypothetical protein
MTKRNLRTFIASNAGLFAIVVGWGLAFLGAYTQEPDGLTAFPTAMYMIACGCFGFASGWFFRENRAQK